MCVYVRIYIHIYVHLELQIEIYKGWCSAKSNVSSVAPLSETFCFSLTKRLRSKSCLPTI